MMNRSYPIPRNVQPRSWDDIEQHYIQLSEYGWGYNSLLELVRYIKSSDLSERLFGYTSLHRLHISIYEIIELNREMLRIEFDHDTQLLHFEYHPKPFEKVEFERYYPADKGIEKFVAFVKLMRW